MRQPPNHNQKSSKQIESLRDALLEVMDDDQKQRWSRDFQNVAVQEIEEAVERVRTTLGKAGLTPSALEKHVGVVADVFKRLDILVSAGAEAGGSPAAFTWGAIKVAITALLELACVRKEVMEATVDGIGCIVDHLPRILEYAPSIPGGRSSLADRAVDLAFREIIDFLVAVASYFSQRKFKQIMFSSELISQIKSAKASLIEKFRNVHYEMCAAEFKKANQYNEDAQYRQLLVVLNAVNVGEDLFSKDSSRMEGTCSWTKAHPLLGDWLGSKYGDIDTRRLWLHGGPGTGKSTVSAYLILQTQQHQSEDEVVIYFFCNYHDATKRAIMPILCSLITQLMESKSVYRSVVQSMMDHVLTKGSNWKFGLREMKKRFIQLLGCYTKARIIIDALEECPDEDTRSLISVIEEALDSHPQLKVLLVSRPEQHVREHLKEWTQIEIGGDDTTQDDIHTYVVEQVARMVKEVPHLRPRQEALRLQFLEATGPMFLYARLAIQNVIDHKHFSPRDVDKLLQTLPQDLHEVYEQYLVNLLQRNDDHMNRIGRRVLQWLVCSEEPLSLDLLALVLAYEGQDDGLDFHQIPHNLKELLNQVLGILVTCRLGEDTVLRAHGKVMRVHLVHQSLSDFLRGLRNPAAQEKRSPNILPLCRSMQAGHFHLLSECSKALSSVTIRPMYLDYLDATDSRRSERPRIERLKCPETRRGDVMYGALETHHGERGQRKHWRRWEPQWYLVQLQDLNRTWRLREARGQQAQKGLADLGNVASKEQERLESMRRKWEADLEDVRKLQSRQKAERSQLDTILLSREREFIIYAQRNLSRHITEAATQGFTREWQLGTLFLTCISLRDALQVVPMVSSAVQKIAGSALAPLPHLIELSTAIHSLLMTLRLFNELPLVDNLHVLNKSKDDSARENLSHLSNRLALKLAEDLEIPDQLFHPIVHEALKDLPPSALRPLAIAAHIISNSRRVETALFRYDEQHPVAIGTSRLIYVLQGAYESLSRWVVLTLIQLSTNEERTKALRKLLMDRDFFLSPIIQRAYQLPDFGGAESEVQYVVHDDATVKLPPRNNTPPATSSTSTPSTTSTSLVPVSRRFGLVASQPQPPILSPNVFVRLIRPLIIWLILLSGFTNYLPTSTILLFTLLSISLPEKYHVEEVGCILALHRLFRSLPGYHSPLPLLLLTTTNLALWIFPTMLRPFLDMSDEESKASIPMSSSDLWSFTYTGDLCARFTSQHGSQYGILHTKVFVERCVGIFARVGRSLPDNQRKGKSFWGLSLLVILLPLIWKPCSPLSILSLLFLCLHQRIQTVLDPGQLLRAKHLLADAQAQSHILLPEMNTLHENSRRALVDEYVRWTTPLPDHGLKTK